ncbi:hypothetical protein [Type-D symbiont of Plautia stali]|uniref:hypothetical protein n=1 Tax=Type-D symbiont of Plautia stali TaxID=1560356 RepID=UPI00073E90FA|nr:hypothetical protein [Type-D symbiont of Plautia stali]
MRFFLCFLLLFIYPALATKHDGVWSNDCNSFDAFEIKVDSSQSPLVINDNQIVILVQSKMVEEDKADIFFSKTLDLGAGGMRLNWNNVSTARKIADINFNERKGFLTWYGFYDEKIDKYFWIKDPDFMRSLSVSGKIPLNKCN